MHHLPHNCLLLINKYSASRNVVYAGCLFSLTSPLTWPSGEGGFNRGDLLRQRLHWHAFISYCTLAGWLQYRPDRAADENTQRMAHGGTRALYLACTQCSDLFLKSGKFPIFFLSDGEVYLAFQISHTKHLVTS